MARGGGIQIKVAGVWNGAGLKRATEDLRNLGRSATSTANDFGTRMQRMGAAAMVLGKHLTKRVTLPLAAIGAAAGKASMDFEDSFAKIQGLVGVSADETNRMKSAVLGLAGPTAQAPRQLGDAMFFVASAGLRGQDALDALEFAAKGAAIGLGETRVVADLVTSAMNAYGPAVLSAEKATDNLTAAVRLGKLEPQELAGSMGQVLPIAAAMGVRFDEVAAAMAAMSRTGTNAATGATQLRQILAQLLKPTTQAEQALAGVGTSAQEVQTSLRERGLLATLQDLQARFDGNTTAMSAVFGNVRALSGVLDMLGSNADETESIFAEMADTTGELNAAFDVASQTAGFKFRQAMANVQVALIRIGDTIAPVIGFVSQLVSGLASGFSKLPKPITTVVTAIGMFAAALGPALWLWGALAKSIGAFVSSKIAASAVMAFKGLSSGIQAAAAQAGGFAALLKTKMVLALGAATAGIGLVVGAVFAVTQAFKNWRIRQAEDNLKSITGTAQGLEIALRELATTGRFIGVLRDTDKWAEAFINLRNAMDLDERARSNVDQFAQLQERFGQTKANGEAATKQIEALREQLAQMLALDPKAAERAYNDFKATMVALGVEGGFVDDQFQDFLGTLETTKQATPGAGGAIGDLGDDFSDLSDDISTAEKRLKDWQDAVRANVDPVFSYQRSLKTLADAQKNEAEAALRAIGVIDRYPRSSKQAQDAIYDHEEAQRALIDAGLDVISNQGALQAAVREGRVSFQQIDRTLRTLTDAGIINAQVADTQRQRWRNLIGQINLTPDAKHTEITSNARDAAQEFWGVAIAQAHIQRRITMVLEVREAVTDAANRVLSAAGFRRATGGRVEANQPYMVGERGREMIVPDSGGWVFNHAETRRMLSDSTTSGGSATETVQPKHTGDINVYVNRSDANPYDIGRELLWTMKVAG